MADLPQMIVAEVSKTWAGVWSGGRAAPSECLCGKFEAVIETNRRRGFRLHSWRFSQVLAGEQTLTETIIAVFEAADPPGGE